MSSGGLGRGIAFAALCAVVCPLYLAGVQPLLGASAAFETAMCLATALYVGRVCPGSRRGRATALLATFGAMALVPLGVEQGPLALLLALTIGLLRSYAAHTRARPIARLGLEVLLLGGGLALAAHLYRGGVAPEALALWGFFLIQSAFALVPLRPAWPTTPGGTPGAPGSDPFAQASRQLRELLGAPHG